MCSLAIEFSLESSWGILTSFSRNLASWQITKTLQRSAQKSSWSQGNLKVQINLLIQLHQFLHVKLWNLHGNKNLLANLVAHSQEGQILVSLTSGSALLPPIPISDHTLLSTLSQQTVTATTLKLLCAVILNLTHLIHSDLFYCNNTSTQLANENVIQHIYYCHGLILAYFTLVKTPTGFSPRCLDPVGWQGAYEKVTQHQQDFLKTQHQPYIKPALPSNVDMTFGTVPNSYISVLEFTTGLIYGYKLGASQCPLWA